MEKTIIVLLLILSLTSFMGEQEISQNNDLNNEADNYIILNVGEEKVIELVENPSTGILWHIENNNKDIIKLIDDSYEGKNAEVKEIDNKKIKKIGGGGVHSWRFKAIKEGIAEITFTLYQSGKSESLYEKKVYKFEIVSAL